MNKLLINIFLVFLMAVNISFAKIVTDDPIEQAAIEALLKDAKLGWNEIKLTKNLIVEGRRNGILLVHRKGRDKRWKITNISDKRIYFDIKGM
ncbi:hypothetical protein [sulfur-oxidizing endosymbiont of Gigantopelta aegis]|uniref:hypothetical protein n=1 Tax=sulfur-oxidizing endosymbiont of Gigantopelta aegis TaxID=2794934 RepID=UPI0018DE4B4B|nr:hypothetical protein [sulfur-oxidizing endosymbiont of Gigantopelta aegis]